MSPRRRAPSAGRSGSSTAWRRSWAPRVKGKARRGGCEDAGSAAIETVLVVPAFGLFVGLIIFAGRVGLANQAVESAAAEAARAASIARTAGEARADATSYAAATLATQSLRCTSTRVDVDTAGFAQPAGTSAQVTATVTCVVNLADLSVPGVPGTRTVTATITSPLDTYRER